MSGQPEHRDPDGLSVPEKILRVQDLWDDIARSPRDVEITPAQREEASVPIYYGCRVASPMQIFARRKGPEAINARGQLLHTILHGRGPWLARGTSIRSIEPPSPLPQGSVRRPAMFRPERP